MRAHPNQQQPGAHDLRYHTTQDKGTGRLTPVKKQQGAQGLTEKEAISRAQAGDAEAFQFLYEMHKRRVYSLCLRMMKDPTDAEDLAQDAFMQLFRKISSFRGDSAFTTWLHRMTVNTVLMHLRKKKLPAISLDEAMDPQDDDGPRLEVGGPDLHMSGAIDRVNLQRAMDELPPGYKEFFILHDVEGFEHNEIAEKLGCSVGNSKSQLHKARMKLRQLLKEEVRKRQADKNRQVAADAAQKKRDEKNNAGVGSTK